MTDCWGESQYPNSPAKDLCRCCHHQDKIIGNKYKLILLCNVLNWFNSFLECLSIIIKKETV
jgi:hypothetical protein